MDNVELGIFLITFSLQYIHSYVELKLKRYKKATDLANENSQIAVK